MCKTKLNNYFYFPTSRHLGLEHGIPPQRSKTLEEVGGPAHWTSLLLKLLLNTSLKVFLEPAGWHVMLGQRRPGMMCHPAGSRKTFYEALKRSLSNSCWQADVASPLRLLLGSNNSHTLQYLLKKEWIYWNMFEDRNWYFTHSGTKFSKKSFG